MHIAPRPAPEREGGRALGARRWSHAPSLLSWLSLHLRKTRRLVAMRAGELRLPSKSDSSFWQRVTLPAWPLGCSPEHRLRGQREGREAVASLCVLAKKRSISGSASSFFFTGGGVWPQRGNLGDSDSLPASSHYLRGWHRVVSFSAFSLARCLPILTAGTVLFSCSHTVWHGKALISAGPLGYNSVTEEPLAWRDGGCAASLLLLLQECLSPITKAILTFRGLMPFCGLVRALFRLMIPVPNWATGLERGCKGCWG